MFTGLIEEAGRVTGVRKSGGDWLLTVACGFDLARVALGDSIAVSGACLTVVDKGEGGFTVQVSEETTRVTTLGRLAVGDIVNLERAMLVGGRLDGHIVQGHVDGIGVVESITPRSRSLEIWFRVPAGVGGYIVAKGSVAVDGVSLTVNQVEDRGEVTRFSVNLIPHTQKKTTLSGLKPGAAVNVESDVLGRYVERLLRRQGGAGQGVSAGRGAGIDETFLREHGFLAG